MKGCPDGTDILPTAFPIIAKQHPNFFLHCDMFCQARTVATVEFTGSLRTSPRPWCPGCSEKTPSTFAVPLVHSARQVFCIQVAGLHRLSCGLALDETEQSTPSGQRSAYDITECTSCTNLASRRTGTSSPLHGRRLSCQPAQFGVRIGGAQRRARSKRRAVRPPSVLPVPAKRHSISFGL